MAAINMVANALRHNKPWNIRVDGASNGAVYTVAGGSAGLAASPWGVGIAYYVAAHTAAGRYIWSKTNGADGWILYADAAHKHGLYAFSTTLGPVFCGATITPPTYLDNVLLIMFLVTPGVDIKMYAFNTGVLIASIPFTGNFMPSSALETAFGNDGTSGVPPTNLHIVSKFSFTGTPSPAQFAAMASYVTTYQGFPYSAAGWTITSCYNFRTGRVRPLPDATLPLLLDETGGGQHMARSIAAGVNYTASYLFPVA